MFSNKQTNDMICNLANHLAENESPELFDEALEQLHNKLKLAIIDKYGFDISELYQLELNHKIFKRSKYEHAKSC